METNLYCSIRTGRTVAKKTMDDSNTANNRDDKITTASLANLYGERPSKLTTNGHGLVGESSSPQYDFNQRRTSADTQHDDNHKKRINPLRIHLGKRPFVDNSYQNYNALKKKKPNVNKIIDPTRPTPRVPKLIPKRLERKQFHNVTSQAENSIDSEKDKPVPRLVPKSQLSQYKQIKKVKVDKPSQLKEYAQSLGLQPMVKFKCRKCCSMSFKTLAMLKEHQLVCSAQVKEPTLSPEATPQVEANTGGPSRVTRKVYLCSACGTYYENWNLFLHMREVHNRHICLFCLGMFSKAEKLSSHLTNKHHVQEFNYDSKEEFFRVYSESIYLMCCACEEICTELDDFFNHDCNNVKPKPVPVLISKNSVKSNNLKQNKHSYPIPPNCHKPPAAEISVSSEIPVVNNDQVESKPLPVTSSEVIPEDSKPEPDSTDTFSSEPSTVSDKDGTTTTETSNSVSIEEPYVNEKTIGSPDHEPIVNNDYTKLPNGPDHEDKTKISQDLLEKLPSESPLSKPLETQSSPVEKECGIKLKLSLNNANSPVIINSTVDPTVGQNIYKPPSRVRRPPKRYEKSFSSEQPTLPPRTPTIKMTISDKAVKTTIYENNHETTSTVLLNNNLESETKFLDSKPENIVKSTIYDNKLEDSNALNRVPKLTVRVPKELLDKDSSSDYSSDSDVSDKLTVDVNKPVEESEITNTMEVKPEPDVQTTPNEETNNEDISVAKTDAAETCTETVESIEPKTEPTDDIKVEPNSKESLITDIPLTELSLNKPLDKYPLKDLLKVFLTSTVHNCIYCNHVRKIAVNCKQLALHMVVQHRFSATVDSITAEELMPETITNKVKTQAEELNTIYINLDTYDSLEKNEEVPFDHLFECFQCYFKTAIHKDLYLHNRKMHQKTILLCVMCKSNFYSYSELICHLCPGTYDSEYDIKFRCCLCNVDTIPSSFRLMVHLRKIHHTCDVCLEFCYSQSRLSNHVWKHKLHHLCYRCGIAYRNKPDITKHLFWKHGTESVMCKKCLQKKWPHVYHFCSPPASFVCDECTLQFTKAVYLKVHKRFHSGDFPHTCTEPDCTEKFVSKKLLAKHLDEHRKKLFIEDLTEEKTKAIVEPSVEIVKEIPTISLIENDNPPKSVENIQEKEVEKEQVSKKIKKKKLKDKDALLLDVNLPALNLSESDSSDESDFGGHSGQSETQVENIVENTSCIKESFKENLLPTLSEISTPIVPEIDPKIEQLQQVEEKTCDQQVLQIWDNFQKYQAKTEKPKEKTPPLVPIRKHVCESDHDYCLIPTDVNGDDDSFGLDKKKIKKSPKKKLGGLSSSSSSSSDSDSSCSCGSNCSCSSSSGSSSSSSSGSDSSDESGVEKKKIKRQKKLLTNRRVSNGSNVDVMGMIDTPILIPEKPEPLIAETDLETDESDTDEEFYDEHPQKLANKILAEAQKRNQLLLLASVAPSESGLISRDASRSTTPVKEEEAKEKTNIEEIPMESLKKPSSSKKKSKKKKKSKSSRKRAPIKINIPKDIITKSEVEEPVPPPLVPNKITISLQSNTVQIPETPIPAQPSIVNSITLAAINKKRASKRRRVPNKFYGYSSDEEATPTTTALKPQQPPKLEWRKEDLPSPVTHRTKKEVPSTTLTHRLYKFSDSRFATPIPGPEPPKILMNTESVSSDSESSDEGALQIYQPAMPVPPPSYLNSGTSSLPYAFERRVVREAKEGESVYCYCRCPYDEVSEMIGCDAEGCPIEWFHFECVGIMVPPKGKWYCPECRKNQSFSGYR